MVSSSMFVAMIIQLLIAVGTPIILFIIFKKKYGLSVKVFLFGMLTFFLFVFIMEAFAHSYFLSMNETTKNLLKNPWLYMLYGGLMAGLFEETGRLVMMKYALRKFREWKDGLAFGLGHGGIESILIVGLNSIVFLVVAVLINNGTFENFMVNGEMKEALLPVKEHLTNGSPFLVLIGGIERLSAIAIHIGLSILVLYAVRSGKMIYYLYAIFFHAMFNFPAALYQKGVIKNIYILEVILAIIAVCMIMWIKKSKILFSEQK